MIRREAQISINKANIDDNKRFKILDLIRYAVQNNLVPQDSLKYIKTNLQKQYGTKWQVALGTQFTGYLNQKIFPQYLETSSRGMTFLIFSRNEDQQKKRMRMKQSQK